MNHTVGIYLYDDVEVLDFTGPFEVFSTAGRVQSRTNAHKPFKVITIASTMRAVNARGGLMVQPHFDILHHPHLDVLVIPGGIIASELQRDDVIDWVKRTAAEAAITASVCTGAFLLAQAGLLRGKEATTHWEDIADLQTMFPDIVIHAGRRWVDTGAIVTSAGISAGIDMSLHLVARLESEELAVRTARQMEFDWHR